MYINVKAARRKWLKSKHRDNNVRFQYLSPTGRIVTALQPPADGRKYKVIHKTYAI